ncbi:MAG TPA: phytoene desaturase family protein [Candidatus Sulfotelmatobacter sp.]|nr:phytoene desaturase family protein [Candidatus Sulfotelmatobacter sp.]
MSSRAVVIGAGLGGLASAMYLRHMGCEVTVVEKNESIGGRCNRWTRDGFTFDTGPTLLLMADVLARLFQECGYSLEEHVELVRMRPNYRITFSDGSRLNISSDVQAMRDELETFEPGAGESFVRFLADAGYKYRISRARFVERNFDHWGQFLAPANLPRFLDTGVLRKLSWHLARYFRDPRLQIAFSFQSMYLGLSPQAAPAVFALLPYTEIVEGIWYPRGGMYQMVLAMASVLQQSEVSIRTSACVERVDCLGSHCTGVTLASGEHLPADIVVCNADLPWAYEKLLPPQQREPYTSQRLEKLRYGSSAMMLYLGMRDVPDDLLHHNVYIGRDVQQNFDDIFKRPAVPVDPAFYVNVSSRTDRTLAPKGGDAVYMLAPAALAGALEWRDGSGAEYRARMIAGLRHLGFHSPEEHIVVERAVTPDDWRDLYNLRRGATFGIAHDLFQVGVMRPANRHSQIRNLFFVGASTQPGGGIPMVFLGARLVAERVARELASR